MIKAVAAAESIGARALTVHAIDHDARRWYGQFGFESPPTDAHHMVPLMKDLRKVLAH